MKFCYNTNFTLPKQSQRSRSILQDGSRSLGLFWKEKILSYNRRNMVDFDHHINKQNCVTTMINIVQTCWIQSRLNDYSLHSRWVKLLQSFNIKLQVIFFFFFFLCVHSRMHRCSNDIFNHFWHAKWPVNELCGRTKSPGPMQLFLSVCAHAWAEIV